jgi:transcriptional regulator with XRE-family HTH domain
MDIIKVFGDNLKKYRTAMGISQEAFADKCGMHRTYISAIECYRRSISLENIQRIADALEIQLPSVHSIVKYKFFFSFWQNTLSSFFDFYCQSSFLLCVIHQLYIYNFRQSSHRFIGIGLH